MVRHSVTNISYRQEDPGQSHQPNLVKLLNLQQKNKSCYSSPPMLPFHTSRLLLLLMADHIQDAVNAASLGSPQFALDNPRF